MAYSTFFFFCWFILLTIYYGEVLSSPVWVATFKRKKSISLNAEGVSTD